MACVNVFILSRESNIWTRGSGLNSTQGQGFVASQVLRCHVRWPGIGIVHLWCRHSLLSLLEKAWKASGIVDNHAPHLLGGGRIHGGGCVALELGERKLWSWWARESYADSRAQLIIPSSPPWTFPNYPPVYILPSHFLLLSAQYSVTTLNVGKYLLIIYTELHCVAISLLDVWAKLPAHRQLGIICAE